jgi:hypothetical protein
MSSVHAVTEDLKFEARIASFYELKGECLQELVQELSKVFKAHGEKHNYITWRVQILQGKKEEEK